MKGEKFGEVVGRKEEKAGLSGSLLLMMGRKLTGLGWAREVWMVVSVDVEVEFVLAGSGLPQKTTSEPKRSKARLEGDL